MKDFHENIDAINKRRLTRREWFFFAVFLVFVVAVIGYFRVFETKSIQPEDATRKMETGTAASEAERLEKFNEELRSSNHPLRKRIETELKIGLSNRSVKRACLVLNALDPQGHVVVARWDEFRYKRWGGYFFQRTCETTVRSFFLDGQWTIVSRLDERTKARIRNDAGAIVSTKPVDYVLIRFWCDKTQQFSEIDESVSRFDADNDNVVIIHGMGGSTHTAWIRKMAQRIKKDDPDTNILGIDWSPLQTKNVYIEPDEMQIFGEIEQTIAWGNVKNRLAQPIDALRMPTETANRIPEVVKQADDHLFGEDGLRLPPSKTHLIGFSHGSHIGGMVGMLHLDAPIARLTVLDPSTRLVHLNRDNRWGTGWGRAAAGFIDMYASSQWAGSRKIYGHKTFFVTEKSESRPWQNPRGWELFNTVGDHKYAAKWFLSTIGDKDRRFGYSIDATQKPDPAWSGTILSTLRKAGEFDGIDEKIVNEIIPGH